MTTFSFSKYSGCGNDFVLIDNRSEKFPIQQSVIRKLCARHTGIGADGVMLVENSVKADFRVRIFNPDGSEAEMCGNGMRCYGKFLQELKIPKKKFMIEATEREISIDMQGKNIEIGMGQPRNILWDLKINVDGKPVSLDYIDTGVPHAIQFVDDVNAVDLLSIGPKVRYHSEFQPKGTNFNVASVKGAKVWIRTYERGVEDETLACGTGATAVALAASRKHGIPSPIVVHTRSGETLEIGFKWVDSVPTDVTSKGPATLIYRGEFAI
jgi:diaminopimelate epimerase